MSAKGNERVGYLNCECEFAVCIQCDKIKILPTMKSRTARKN